MTICIGRIKLLIALVCCLTAAGCGKKAAGSEPGAAASGAVAQENAGAEETRPVPVYTTEDDAEAAAYLREQYGILSDGSVPKVILDTDMTYYGDDAMCMCILVEADRLGLVDLLGVTVTGGNSFVAAGTNSALNQLELFGREDIPVYMGTDEPLGGFRDMDEQEKIVGSIDHWGVLYGMDRYVEPAKYHDLGASYVREWGYSKTDPGEQSSVDFMLEQVKKYPGEVTIISVGAATNIAAACLQDENFASGTAGIIYMGTAANGQGSYTPYADFNVFYDAEAFAICLNSGFPSQIIVPHEISKEAVLDKAVFDLMDAKNRTCESKMWLDGQYSLYKRTETKKAGCADAVAAVALLMPDVGFKQETYYVKINTDLTQARYGETVLCSEAGQGARAVYILDLDRGRFWDFVTDLICHTQEAAPCKYDDFFVK